MKSEVKNKRRRRPSSDNHEIISLTNVSKTYSTGAPALNGVDLHINRGEFVFIVGDSGSGKSTLLNLIGGLDYPTKGKIFVKNREIGSLPRKKLTIFRRRNIGFVFQNYSLMPVLNVYDNVALPVTFDRGKHINRKYIEELLRGLGVWEKRTKYPSELSGGQQQRVAIARALVNKPQVLLCDEPTGNLDSATTIEVIGLLKASCRKYKQTILMVTHNEAIAQTCDRVIHMEDGQIVTGKRIFPVKGGDGVC